MKRQPTLHPDAVRTNVQNVYVWVGLIVLACLAFSPVRSAGYIWDDNDYVTENPYLRSVSGLGTIWFSKEQTSQYFPLTYTSFWFEYRLWGLHPLGYHLINVLLHATNAWLAWL